MATQAAPAPRLVEDSIFRRLFDAYPDSLIVADASGRIVLANPGAAKLLGYAVEELVGLDVDALVPDAIRPRHANYRESYARNPRARPMGTHMELVAKRRDGSEVMVEIGLSPLQDLGSPYVVAAIRDIGAYPRVKQALQRARYSEHLAQLGRLAVDARDPQVVLQEATSIAAQALQADVAQVFLLEPDRLAFKVVAAVGAIESESLGCTVLNRPDTPPGFVLDQARPVIVTDYRSEHRYIVPKEYVDAGLVSALAVPLLDRGRIVGALAVRSREAQRFGDDEVRFLESMSNLLATSLQRAHSEEALNHAQRLESVGQLTGGIAHDFNNLLTVIQGNLQVLDELPALANDPYGRQLVDAATRASRRGAELTSKLLAFSSRQVLQPSVVDVSAMLGSLAGMLRRTLDQRIRIEVDVAADCPNAFADAGQLESALLNIAINARDAMPEGGTLSFRAQRATTFTAQLRMDLDDPDAHEDDFVAISIADNGSGMSDEVKERAFEPFFTTKQAGRGTGLGLSTVYGFVKQSHGAVAIESSPDAGTTLRLYIPRSREEAAQSPSGDVAKPLRAGLRVLLVEDDSEVRVVVRNFLDTLQCVVTVAANAEEAMALLGADAAFDVLLSDISLGAGARGTELAQFAQERMPKLAVLLMSGYSAELIDANRNSPASWELLRKPYSRDELAAAISRIVDAG